MLTWLVMAKAMATTAMYDAYSGYGLARMDRTWMCKTIYVMLLVMAVLKSNHKWHFDKLSAHHPLFLILQSIKRLPPSPMRFQLWDITAAAAIAHYLLTLLPGFLLLLLLSFFLSFCFHQIPNVSLIHWFSGTMRKTSGVHPKTEFMLLPLLSGT